ncbi:MAG: elongation factor G [Polyangiaceae bacterium]|nr:elongation factor G [Polyangiaceae bacterium]
MKVYDSGDIRNVVFVGHQGSGKTLLCEAMLHATGAISRMGSLDEGSTVSDYHDVETQRKMSIFASLLHVEHKGTKLNIIDAPGYPDFVGEVVASMRVADAAVLLMSAADGVQVGTELSWGYAEKAQKPVIMVLNHCDRDGDFDAVVAGIKERFGRGATVLQTPGGGHSLVDILSMKKLTFHKSKLEPDVAELEGTAKSDAEALRTALVEMVAENDEALMERYLEQGGLSEDELQTGLRAAVKARQIFPILLTSASEQVGIGRLCALLSALCPSPLDAPATPTVDGGTIACDAAGEPVAFVYRTLTEQHVGDYSFLKVASGTLEQGMDLENAQTSSLERLGGIFALNGRHRDTAQKVVAGDLGAVVKLKDTHTNQTLHHKGAKVVVAPIEFPEPRYKCAIKAVNAGEEDKLSAGLHKIAEEDPSLRIIHDSEMNQMLLAGVGEMQLEVARARLKARFGVDVALTVPKVSYRETVQTGARASYRHKKQTGGAGQFADISMAIEPFDGGEYQAPADINVRNATRVKTDWGAEIEFVDAIVSGVIDMKRFFGAIQKGVLDAMHAGPIAGYPCGSVRIVIFDGKMHAVDSNENAFKTASRMCFREAFAQAQPVLLEPIMDVEVLVPEEFTGDVMGDLNTRRARIQGMQAEGPFQKIVAQAPEVEILRYATTVRSLTQGRGMHTARFRAYAPMPRNVQEKIVAEAQKAKTEE